MKLSKLTRAVGVLGICRCTHARTLGAAFAQASDAYAR